MSILINFKICDNAPECDSIKSCPTGALFWDDVKKEIGVDNSKCICCKKCEEACPVGAIKVAKNKEEEKEIKEEYEGDWRKKEDLFVDRYGANPIDPHTFISLEELKTLIKTGKKILIEFFYDNSAQCLLSSIPIKELVKGQDEIIYRKVKVDEDAKKEFGVSKLPCLVLFENQNVMSKAEGVFYPEEFDKLKEELKFK